MSIALITTLLERTIAFHPVFRDVAGSTVGGVFLSQAYYWSTGGRIAAERAGWFYKTGKEWTEETRLSRSEQDRARRDLKAVGLLEERLQGRPAKMFYRLNLERLFELILEVAQGKPVAKKPKKNTSLQDSAILAGSEKKANKINSLQDSANYAQPEPSKSPDLPEKPNEIHSLQDSASSLQNPASQFAESCKLYTEITTENTSEITAGSSARVGGVQNVFQEPSADTREKFSMHENWQVSESFQKQCGIRGLMLDKLDPDRLVDEVRDFVGYWVARPEITNPQSLWEHKLTQHLQRAVRRGVFNTGVNHGYANQSSNSGKPKSAAQVHAESCAGAFDQYASGGAGYGEAWADGCGQAGAIDGEWSSGSASAERFD